VSGVPVMQRVTAFLASPRGRIVVLGLRLLVAAVFLAAAIPKVLDPASFATDIDNYRVVPDALIGPMAVVLPLVETTIGLALVTGLYARGAAILASGMLVTFAIAMVQAIARGIDLDCGCFGHVVETQVSWMTVTRNVVLTLVCAAIALGPDLPLWPLAGTKTLSPS
jgi:putative oxidoreductase